MSSTRPVDPTDRQDVLAVVEALARHVDVMTWHVAQLRPGAETEITYGMDAIKEAIRVLRKNR